MKPEDINWVRKQFKNNKVWVAADKRGQPIILKNKVCIKYQLDQEHQYWVNQKTVAEIAADGAPRNSLKTDVNGQSTPRSREKTPSPPVTDPPNAVSIHTDGASSGNPGPSGIGVVMAYGGHEKEISKYIGIATNNIAELTAIQTALMSLKRNDMPVRIYTDSGYACGLLLSGWKAKKNVALVRAIKELMARFTDLKIIKVKGHSGIRGNERADQLATSAITSCENTTG